jgi:flagellar assembly protein FliH
MPAPSIAPAADLAAIEHEKQRRIAEEARKGEERGLARGIELGHARARDEASQLVAAERDRLQAQAAALVASNARDRDRYFARVEEESVRLALAIAARILRREAQMDPLLLTGAVRVALGQLAQSTSVRLHVPAQDAPLWQEALKHLPGIAAPPAVVPEVRMELGDCRIETGMGSADLGLKAQLREIERGFFDRVGSGSRSTGHTENMPGEANMAGEGAQDTPERNPGKSPRRPSDGPSSGPLSGLSFGQSSGTSSGPFVRPTGLSPAEAVR